MKLRYKLQLLIFGLLIVACSDSDSDPIITTPPDGTLPPSTTDYEITKLLPYTQRTGDAQKGYNYLITGDYMSSGIPYNAFLIGNGQNNENILNREGENAKIPHEFNAVKAPNGVTVVAPNCLQCHSTQINNELVIGLGNSTLDFSVNRIDYLNTLVNGVRLLYGENSKEWDAFNTFKRNLEAVAPKTVTKSRGVNVADKSTIAIISIRDKNTLELLNEPAIKVSDEVIPSDVPAWWLLKKKNAMFYPAIGRNDYCRIMITMILSTLDDVEKAKEVDANFPDILAYIKNLEAPEYPYNVDQGLADQGKSIFLEKCAICHGTYGSSSSYPNFLVSLNTIGTDPALSNFYSQPSVEMDYFKDWFNNGWFGQGANALRGVTDGGYIAPPLDGVWATAPYFHNASVPTIEDVLNSKKRPKYWRRSYESSDYDQDKLGWKYTSETGQQDSNTYDTTQKGYGNQGHTFGDDLTDAQRKSLIEYLKTL
jgi:cytochrome c5